MTSEIERWVMVGIVSLIFGLAFAALATGVVITVADWMFDRKQAKEVRRRWEWRKRAGR